MAQCITAVLNWRWVVQTLVTPNFKWDTSLNFSYNKNKLVDVEDSETTVHAYSSGHANVMGYPINALLAINMLD